MAITAPFSSDFKLLDESVDHGNNTTALLRLLGVCLGSLRRRARLVKVAMVSLASSMAFSSLLTERSKFSIFNPSFTADVTGNSNTPSQNNTQTKK